MDYIMWGLSLRQFGIDFKLPAGLYLLEGEDTVHLCRGETTVAIFGPGADPREILRAAVEATF